jgi:hypothetical protein
MERAESKNHKNVYHTLASELNQAPHTTGLGRSTRMRQQRLKTKTCTRQREEKRAEFWRARGARQAANKNRDRQLAPGADANP